MERRFRDTVKFSAVAAGTFFVVFVGLSMAYGAYSSFVASDFAAPRAGGSTSLSSASWNKVLDNVESLQSQISGVSGAGRLVGFAYSKNVTNSSISTAIPWDDTVPQNTEGAEVLSATLTPKSATNLLEVEAVVHYSENENWSDYFVLSAFQDSATNAFASAASTTE